jgi:hypothetical protein
MMRMAGIESGHIPCLSVAMRFWLRPQSMWLSYLPAALGCAWALGYFWPRRHTWDWMNNGSLLMLIALVSTPYSWVYDDSLVIPSLLHGAYHTRSRILLALLAFASLALDAELLSGVKIYSSFYLWTAPLWLAWYLFARAYGKKQPADDGQLLTPPMTPDPFV